MTHNRESYFCKKPLRIVLSSLKVKCYMVVVIIINASEVSSYCFFCSFLFGFTADLAIFCFFCLLLLLCCLLVCFWLLLCFVALRFALLLCFALLRVKNSLNSKQYYNMYCKFPLLCYKSSNMTCEALQGYISTLRKI